MVSAIFGNGAQDVPEHAKSRAIVLSEPTAAAKSGTIVEVFPPGQRTLPKRGTKKAGPALADSYARLLSALVGPGAGGIVELNFRKAIEALAPATVAAQISDLRCYAMFCDRAHRRGVPASEANVVAWIEHLEERKLRPATVARRLSSLASVHGLLGRPSPTDAAVVRHALKGLKRRVGVGQRQASGMRLGDSQTLTPTRQLTLSALLASCDTDCPGLRDAALISIGYDAGLRVSELVDVDFSDLEPDEDGSGLLLIPRSKTDQEGEGLYAWVSRDSMRRVSKWVDAAAIKSGPLFRRVAVDRRKPVAARAARTIADLAPNAKVDRTRMIALAAQPARIRYVIGTQPLTRQGINLIYRKLARKAADLGYVALIGDELDAAIAALSTHSLRVGLAQDLFAAGEDVGPISQALRWKSTTTALRYARKLAPKANAAARVLGKVRK